MSRSAIRWDLLRALSRSFAKRDHPSTFRLDDRQPIEVPKFSRGYARTFPRNSGHNLDAARAVGS